MPKKHTPGANGVTRVSKKALLVSSTLGAILATIVGLNQASPIIDDYWPATHAYVKEMADRVRNTIGVQLNTTNDILRDIQIEQAQGKLEVTRDNIVKAEIEKSKATNDATSALIDSHLKNLQATAQKLQDQLADLRKLRALSH